MSAGLQTADRGSGTRSEDGPAIRCSSSGAAPPVAPPVSRPITTDTSEVKPRTPETRIHNSDVFLVYYHGVSPHSVTLLLPGNEIITNLAVEVELSNIFLTHVGTESADCCTYIHSHLCPRNRDYLVQSEASGRDLFHRRNALDVTADQELIYIIN